MNADQLAQGNRIAQSISERESILEFFQDRKGVVKYPAEAITQYLNAAQNVGSKSHREQLAAEVVQFIIKREQEAIAALNKEFESL